MKDTLKNIIQTVAPTLGVALGGPLGGMAIKFIGEQLLGKANVSENEILEHVSSPHDLEKLKNVDKEFAAVLKRIDLDITKLEIDNVKDARKREIVMKDRMPSVMAILLTMGFFGLLILVMTVTVTSYAKPILEVMVGAMGSAFLSVINYYFGSSRGSTLKTILSEKNRSLDSQEFG